MNESEITNPYLLLTPGPLSTSGSVRKSMLRDWCTWDNDYNEIVQSIREKLVEMCGVTTKHSCVLMQGSGTFSVESVIGSVIPAQGKLLVLANGAYGKRMAEIATYLNIPVMVSDSGETNPPDLKQLSDTLEGNPDISHVAVVHCETTTGMLNPVKEIGDIAKGHGKQYIVDAMSSFGGIPIALDDIKADFLVSSANKCIQGVPGFGFIIATRDALQASAGCARSLSLDLYSQWKTMQEGKGKWRFTSPTHTVRAFAQALSELDAEGGVMARNARYIKNQKSLVEGMQALGFQTLLDEKYQSPIITSFLSPDCQDYKFEAFYESLKKKGFVIYPGKVTGADTFRIGNIGDVHPEDIDKLIKAVGGSIFWKADHAA